MRRIRRNRRQDKEEIEEQDKEEVEGNSIPEKG